MAKGHYGGKNKTQNHFPVPVQKTGKPQEGHWTETVLKEENCDSVSSVAAVTLLAPEKIIKF